MSDSQNARVSSAVSQITKKYFFFFMFYVFYVLCSGFRALLTTALMTIKQYTVFRCLLPLSAKYGSNNFTILNLILTLLGTQTQLKYLR